MAVDRGALAGRPHIGLVMAREGQTAWRVVLGGWSKEEIRLALLENQSDASPRGVLIVLFHRLTDLRGNRPTVSKVTSSLCPVLITAVFNLSPQLKPNLKKPTHQL